MSEKDQGSKTEQPTSKKLKEARKKGDIAKVADVSLTIGFIFALLLLWLVFSYVTEGVSAMLELALSSPTMPFDTAVSRLGQVGLKVFLGVSALIIVPLALFSLLVEFIVNGPVFTAEKFKPKMSHLNPVEGMKRMFGMDNLVELIKSVFKTGILAFAAYLAVRSVLGDLVLMTGAEAENIPVAIWYLAVRIFGWTSAAYLESAAIVSTHGHLTGV